MLIQKNELTLDTCGCVLFFEGEADFKDGAIVIETLKTRQVDRRPCAFHADKGPEVAVKEAQLRSSALGKILEDDAFGETVVTPDGSTVRQFKEGVEVKYSFDEKRELTLELPQTLKRETTKIQSALDATFPQDKITVR